MRFAMALLLAAIAFEIPALAGQSSEGADKLASLRVTGSQRYHSEQIVAALGLHLGQAITREDLQRVADRLAQLGPFADVQYRFASTAAGVTAEYDVKDAPALRVAFDNFPWFTDEELTAAVEKAGVLFDGTAPDHGTVLDSIADALETLGVSHGFYAKVTHKVSGDPANEVTVQEFQVQDSHALVAKLEFSDSIAQADHGVQSRLVDLAGKPFSRSAIHLFEFEQVRPLYLSKGYLEVRFAPPAAQLAQGSNAKPTQDVNVTAGIDRGPAFAFGGVVWSGNAALSRDDLDKLLPLRAHDVADGMKIESLWQTVRDEYGKRGYLDADVMPHAVFDQAAKGVAYSVVINEGTQYHMGNLTLSGLSVEGEKRIRQAWKMEPGVVFDEKAYQDFLNSGAKQAFASLPFHYDMIGRFLDKNPATGVVDVLLDFE